jgi:hypothetical protein
VVGWLVGWLVGGAEYVDVFLQAGFGFMQAGYVGVLVCFVQVCS